MVPGLTQDEVKYLQDYDHTLTFSFPHQFILVRGKLIHHPLPQATMIALIFQERQMRVCQARRNHLFYEFISINFKLISFEQYRYLIEWAISCESVLQLSMSGRQQQWSMTIHFPPLVLHQCLHLFVLLQRNKMHNFYYDHLAWPFYSEMFRVKPMHYVSWLMGHEGPGSILSFLIKR